MKTWWRFFIVLSESFTSYLAVSMLTLATMLRHSSLFCASRMTSPIPLHPTSVLIPSMNLICCLSLALVPLIAPSKQSFSSVLPLNTWPRYLSCLWRIVVISFLEVPAIRITFVFVILAVHDTLSNLPMNHISVASNLFFITVDRFQLSQPYRRPDHT